MGTINSIAGQKTGEETTGNSKNKWPLNCERPQQPAFGKPKSNERIKIVNSKGKSKELEIE